jgi:sugar-specific transcriptional regulator TrmB
VLHTQKVITNLSELGLNKYEAKVYLTLVTEGVSTAKNLSDISAIPYGKVYEIINALVSKGFVMVLPTKPMKCKAVSPKEALINIRKKQQEKLEIFEKLVLKDLEPVFNKNKAFIETKNNFWVIKGRSNINKNVEALISKAKKKICILSSQEGLKRIGFFKELLEEANERKVKILIGGKIEEDNLDDMQNLNFCDVRHIEDVPCHLFSIDGKECMLVEPMPDDDDLVYGRDIAVLIPTSSFASFLEDSFISNFSNAERIQERVKRELKAYPDREPKNGKGANNWVRRTYRV